MMVIVRLADNKTEKRIFNVKSIYVYDNKMLIKTLNGETNQEEIEIYPFGTWLAIFK